MAGRTVSLTKIPGRRTLLTLGIFFVNPGSCGDTSAGRGVGT
jgi:hypothetical protein